MSDIGYFEPRARMTEVTELLGLTARAIRLYEERGLIAPSRDRLGRREFDLRTRARLEAIAKLRRAGLGLESIEALMSRPLWRGQALASLAQKRDELLMQLSELEAVEAWLAAGDLGPGENQVAPPPGGGPAAETDRAGARMVARPA